MVLLARTRRVQSADRRTDRHTYRQTDKETDEQMNRRTGIQRD